MIILYSQPGCPQCRTIHMLLKAKKAEFQEVQDITVMREKGICHTPAIETPDSQILLGQDLVDYVKGM